MVNMLDMVLKAPTKLRRQMWLPQTETSIGGEDEKNCSTPLLSRFLDVNLCGIPDIDQRTPLEHPEMRCPEDTEQVLLLNL